MCADFRGLSDLKGKGLIMNNREESLPSKLYILPQKIPDFLHVTKEKAKKLDMFL